MILTVAEDFDGFKTVYSVVDMSEDLPIVIKSFDTQEEAESYIRNTPVKDMYD